MGANSSPPASDAAMAAATASMKNKKRKTSDALPPASLAAAQTSPEAVAANNNAESLHTEATLERMATALDLSHSLLDRALLDSTLPKSTSLAMEDSRSRLEQFSSFVDALRSADVEGVALQLQRMFVSDTGVLATLRDGADRAVAEATANSTTAEFTRMRRISSASIPAVVESTNNSNRVNDTSTTANNSENSETNTNNNRESSNNANNNNGNHADESEDVNMDGDNDGDSLAPRAVLHEAEAAQALTGLRLSSAGANSSAAAAAAAAVAAVAAAGGPLPSPRPPMRPAASAAATATTTATASSPTLPALVANMPPVSQSLHLVSVASTSTVTAMNTRNLSAIPSSVPYNATPLPSLSPSHGHGHGGPTLSIFAPQQSPMMVMADHSGHMMPTFSPHPGSSSANGNGLFVTAPSPHQPHSKTTMAMSPGSLPSLFARGLLAPIATPYDPSKNEFHGFVVNGNGGGNGGNGGGGTTPLTPLLTPHGHHLSPFIDWKSLSMTTPLNGNMNSDASSIDSMSQKHQPFTHTIQTPASTNGNPYHTSSSSSPSHPRDGGGGQASPVKRKSITSKQLVAAAQSHGANLTLPIAKSLAALERTHPARKANPRRWTKEEDDALRMAVENHKEKNWKAIAAQVPGRNHTQCLQRWTKVLAPGLVKGHWSPHEDELLKRLVAGGNKNWGEVAAKIPGRTSKQCRERWHNHLDPNIVRGAYSPEEDRIILEAQARLGNRWSVIAAMLPGRTEDAVKIRWKSHCRLWKARKYLRKSGASGNGGDADDGMDPMDGMDEGDSSEDEEGDAQSYDDDDDQQQDNSAATSATSMPVAA